MAWGGAHLGAGSGEGKLMKRAGKGAKFRVHRVRDIQPKER